MSDGASWKSRASGVRTCGRSTWQHVPATDDATSDMDCRVTAMSKIFRETNAGENLTATRHWGAPPHVYKPRILTHIGRSKCNTKISVGA